MIDFPIVQNVDTFREGQIFAPGHLGTSSDENSLRYFHEGGLFSENITLAPVNTFGIKSQILKYEVASLPIDTAIVSWNPSPVEDPTDPLNTFSPVLIVDGVVYFGTPPVGVTDLIDLDWTQFTAGICEALSYNVSLGFGGGSFEFQTEIDPMLTIGQTLDVAGLKGIVMESMIAIVAGGQHIWITKGIFGSPNMEKQLLLYISGMEAIAGLAPNIYLGQPTVAQWSSIRVAAKAIANALNVDLQWLVQDQPLYEIFGETGLTIIDALHSLASRVNATVLWNGKFGYVVADLQEGWGGANLRLDCAEIATGGIQGGKIFNLKRTAVLQPVTAAQVNAVDWNEHPLAAPRGPSVTQLYSSPQAVKAGVKQYLELPSDYKRNIGLVTSASAIAGGKIRVIPNDIPSGVSSPFIPPLTADPAQGTIYDPGVWFDATLPIITDRHSGKDLLDLSALPFPSGGDNKCSISVGFERDFNQLEELQKELVRLKLEQAKLRQAAENSKLAYFKIGASQVNVLFQGYIPLPGRKVDLVFDGVPIKGIIESTNIQNGIMSLAIGDHVHVNRMTARGKLDYYQATGQPPP